MTWKKEVGRKAVHLSWGLVLLAYLRLEQSYGRAAIWLPFSILLVVLAADILRTQYKLKLPLLRDRESRSLFTPTTTMIGITLALSIYDKEIATAAILMMVFGDVAANLAGRIFGRTKIGAKTLEGSIAGLATNLAVGILTVSLPTAAIMAAAATATELAVREIDDNMVITLAAGLVGQLMR